MRRTLTLVVLVVLVVLTSVLPAGTATARTSPASMELEGNDNGARDDRLRANAPAWYEGETIRLFRKQDAEWVLVDEGALNRYGNYRFVVDDLNGVRVTRYLARVNPVDPELWRTSARKPVI